MLVRRLAANLPVILEAPKTPLDIRQHQTRLTPAQVKDLVAAYEAGADMNALARRYGIHRQSVRNRLLQAGVELRRLGLTTQQLDECARLYVAGASLSKLGEQFNCDHTTVRRGLRRRGLKLRKPWESAG